MILGENYMGIFSKIMGTHSERELKRVYPIVDKIEAMGSAMEKLSDEELRAKTDEFKKRLSEGETLDDLLVEAYAVVREAATRVLGMRHYRVQLIGGIDPASGTYRRDDVLVKVKPWFPPHRRT